MRPHLFINRVWNDRAGASAIEFALVAGIFSVLTLGIVDFGRAFWQTMEVQSAAQATADYIQNKGYNLSSAQNAAINATNLSITSANITVTASGYNGVTCGCPGSTGITMGLTCGSACAGGYGTAMGYTIVNVSSAFSAFFPWPGLPSQLSAKAVAICRSTSC